MKKEISDLLEELKANEKYDPSGKNPGLLKMISIHGQLLSILSEESALSSDQNLRTAKTSLKIAYIAAAFSIIGVVASLYPIFTSPKAPTEIKHFHEHIYTPNSHNPTSPNWPNVGTLTPGNDTEPNNELKKAAQNKESKGAPSDTIIQPPTLPIPQPAPQ